MQSIEQKSPISNSAVSATPYLSQKMEQHTNKLLESLKKSDRQMRHGWIVLDLSGKILAAGASTNHSQEISDSLF